MQTGGSVEHGLSEEQLQELHRALIDKRRELLSALELPAEDFGDQEPGDAADRATSEIVRGERIELAERQRALLDAIEHALGKFDTGTYGLSEKSGRQIPLERLRALPWATTDADER